ncbi:16S rRNA (guanine(966)-N(2))-methyltransferase RsmD [Pseudohongiella spirulinae]|uniref:Ribosomal RNA small subunit methyltransferase D n=1 Tax=Pseudohongiella spirulinae TaxID=1249552 RepID=A0A0S2KHZ1_9GAMM|nr:16S rRNA (guanine(966)-N(2))-methyltransferase RsmD [Pseudohongiella spirulinae]ALO47583.1 16S rRNA methyltransferase [Pseudohongiella spirulinae]
MIPNHKFRARSANGSNSLRIIAGLWRGRRVSFPDVQGLRPTPDRVRETVFNWLQTLVISEDCLDLYAGSGACGFEALSRGARSVTFVDASSTACQHIRDNLQILQRAPGYHGSAQVVQSRAENWLSGGHSARQFGLVFLDPPFADGVLIECCRQLQESGALKSGAHIYVESGDALPIAGQTAGFPPHWQLLKNKRAGKVFYGLYRSEP